MEHHTMFSVEVHMKMIFEIRDLNYATPATATRAGIVCHLAEPCWVAPLVEGEGSYGYLTCLTCTCIHIITYIYNYIYTCLLIYDHIWSWSMCIYIYTYCTQHTHIYIYILLPMRWEDKELRIWSFSSLRVRESVRLASKGRPRGIKFTAINFYLELGKLIDIYIYKYTYQCHIYKFVLNKYHLNLVSYHMTFEKEYHRLSQPWINGNDEKEPIYWRYLPSSRLPVF